MSQREVEPGRPTVTADDVRVVARFLDDKRAASAVGGRGVMLSLEDVKGFALVLHAAADALSLPREAKLPCPTCGTTWTAPLPASEYFAGLRDRIEQREET